MVLSPLLDLRRRGTNHTDRMHRIMAVVADCGLAYHLDKSGRPVTDIEADGIEVTGQYERYRLAVKPRVLPRLLNMAPQFGLALNVPGVAVEVDGGRVIVRVPIPQKAASRLDYPDAFGMGRLQPGVVLLGQDEDGAQLALNLLWPENVHCAVVGMTGSGKSNLMRCMALSALQTRGVHVALLDPTGDMLPLSGHPLIWRGGLFQDVEDIALALEALTAQINRQQSGVTLVFVDEVPDLVAQCPPIRDHLGRLAQAGRHAGIHLILGAQNPLTSELGSATLRNVPVRIVGRVADRIAAYNAAGRGDTGAELLRGKGDFLLVTGGDRIHFQAPYVADDLLAEWAERFPPRLPRVPVRAERSPEGGAERNAEQIPAGGRFVRAGGSGGRGLDDIPPEVIEMVRAYRNSAGRWPSLTWIYEETRTMYESGGFGRDKARRALIQAGGYHA
jgi:DNA segregation ATPase FtsK/SpoIIIE-like protein